MKLAEDSGVDSCSKPCRQFGDRGKIRALFCEIGGKELDGIRGVECEGWALCGIVMEFLEDL